MPVICISFKTAHTGTGKEGKTSESHATMGLFFPPRSDGIRAERSVPRQRTGKCPAIEGEEEEVRRSENECTPTTR